jgi:sigma-B regulation protein RsbU (phosphoserine phosphatase)
MVIDDPQFPRTEILRIFNHAELYLFLGVAITTIGLLAGFFSLLRRRFDPLLLWFALFAILYGVRLDLDYQLVWGLGLHPVVLQWVALAIKCLVPIPAFCFFRTLNLFAGRGRFLPKRVVWPVAIGLSVAAPLIGYHQAARTIGNVLVITAFFALIVLVIRVRVGPPDLVMMQRGLLIFVACAVFDSASGILGRASNIEPFGFLVLLGSFGVIAGRRAFAYEQRTTVLHKELEIATQIQLSILPASFPPMKNFHVASRYLPMTSVAGDFYDFLHVTDSEAGILIADVSGHGVPAALIASMVKLAAASQRAKADRPSDFLLGMNAALLGNTQSQFVTAGYVYLNGSTREFRYSAAGHPPMLLHRHGEIIEITERGIPLALFNVATYGTSVGTLESGDRLILYTDGILEAPNEKQEELGSDRFYALIRETSICSHTEAADAIVSAVQKWSATQGDDLTIIVCDYTA